MNRRLNHAVRIWKINGHLAYSPQETLSPLAVAELSQYLLVTSLGAAEALSKFIVIL